MIFGSSMFWNAVDMMHAEQAQVYVHQETSADELINPRYVYPPCCELVHCRIISLVYTIDYTLCRQHRFTSQKQYDCIYSTLSFFWIKHLFWQTAAHGKYRKAFNYLRHYRSIPQRRLSHTPIIFFLLSCIPNMTDWCYFPRCLQLPCIKKNE